MDRRENPSPRGRPDRNENSRSRSQGKSRSRGRSGEKKNSHQSRSSSHEGHHHHSHSRTRDGNKSRVYRPPIQEARIDSPQSSVPGDLYVVSTPRDHAIENGSVASQLTPEAGEATIDALRPPRSTINGDYRLAGGNGQPTRHRSYQYPQNQHHPYPNDTKIQSSPYHADIKTPSPIHRMRLNRWYQKRFPVLSKSISEASTWILSSDGTSGDETGASVTDDSLLSSDMEMTESSDPYAPLPQSVAYFTISVTSVQLLTLMLQVCVCGFAPFDVNGFLGPYPDAFSEWGGKNAYRMKHDNEWWRMVTPAFLSIGFVQLLANSVCQLHIGAMFEREWGSMRWMLIWVLSACGCTALSSLLDQDTIAVESSGALMGLYGAKIAQVFVFINCNSSSMAEPVRTEHLSSVMCAITLTAVMSVFPYVDWTAHMGGLVTGFFTGMVLLSDQIEGCCYRFLWVTTGFLCLVASLTAVMYLFITVSEPLEDIGNACEYFRNLFPENYDCVCLW